MGFTQSVKGRPTKSEKTNSWVRENSSCQTTFEYWGTLVFHAFELPKKYWFLLCLEPADLHIRNKLGASY